MVFKAIVLVGGHQEGRRVARIADDAIAAFHAVLFGGLRENIRIDQAFGIQLVHEFEIELVILVQRHVDGLSVFNGDVIAIRDEAQRVEDRAVALGGIFPGAGPGDFIRLAVAVGVALFKGFNASRMGMGNPATSEYTLMPSVLRSRGQKLEDVTKRIKCSMPTQLLPMMPLRKEKSLNAIWMPYMGT